MSNRLFPSTIQSLVNKAKLLSISFAPQGAQSAGALTGGFANIPSPAGVKSVVYNSTGNYTVNLQNAFRSLISAQVNLQLAAATSGATASYTWVDATDTNSVTFQAGPNFPGTLGNSLKVVVATGAALASTITYSGGITTVTITINTGTTTPALLATYVNTTAAATLGGTITISAHSGTTPFSAFLSSTALTGGLASVVVPVITSANATAGGTNPQAVIVQFQDANSGNAVDVAANAGNLLNLLLLVKDAAY